MEVWPGQGWPPRRQVTGLWQGATEKWTGSALWALGEVEAGELESWGSSGAVTLGPGREGGQAAQFAGSDEVMGELWQGVTVPFEAGPVILTFWWMAEAETQQPGDAQNFTAIKCEADII